MAEVSAPTLRVDRFAVTPLPIAHLAIVIPARNEAERIEACLTSLVAARTVLHRGMMLRRDVTSSIVVVADSCTDGTAERAAPLLDPSVDVVVQIEAGCAGEARRIGTYEALRRAPVPPDRTWVCSTDADSTVPTEWLQHHVAAAEAGLVAVAGIVQLDQLADPTVRRGFTATYAHHMDGTHPHVHGTNLGFRGDAYLRAGGWGAQPTGEDHDLWSRLATVGATASTVRLAVTTSSRLVGRAPDGFAADLATLACLAGPTELVETKESAA